jgi:hypothetical protein
MTDPKLHDERRVVGHGRSGRGGERLLVVEQLAGGHVPGYRAKDEQRLVLY